MYRVLLVDDEAPALRYMQAIISKYLTGFTIADSFQSGEKALNYLSQHAVDLLITDIKMPGMDGIDLAMKARALYPTMHIAIISGYAEFEYAKGAISAAVDEYLLKPLIVSHMVDSMKCIQEKLDSEYDMIRASLLSKLICELPYDSELLDRLYGGTSYYFALARWGNLSDSRFSKLTVTLPYHTSDCPWFILRGRDEDELIYISKADTAQPNFPKRLLNYLLKVPNTLPCTAVCARRADKIDSLPVFLQKAAQMMSQCLVIGKSQLLDLTPNSAVQKHSRISAVALKKLDCFIASNLIHLIKDYFLSLAVEWEQQSMPQYLVENMVRQIVHQALNTNQALFEKQDAIYRDMINLFQNAASYGDLIAGLYLILFEDVSPQDKRVSGGELCEYAMRYIRDNYAQPMNIQSVCSEVGISQTYLCRLLRKHGDTTFSAYLTKCRMDAAMTLIQQHPDILLRDVSACVGYDDQSYFSKVFHQATGFTPKKYAADIQQIE